MLQCLFVAAVFVCCCTAASWEVVEVFYVSHTSKAAVAGDGQSELLQVDTEHQPMGETLSSFGEHNMLWLGGSRAKPLVSSLCPVLSPAEEENEGSVSSECTTVQ